MTTKGQTLTSQTKALISEAKTKFDVKALEATYQAYIQELNATPELFPSLAGLAKRYGMTQATILNHIDLPAVQSIIDQIATLQEAYLLENGITGKASPAFAQFLLKSKHHYQDDKPVLNQYNNMNISPEVLKDALELMQKSPRSK